MPETKLVVLKLHQIPVHPRFQVREAGLDAFHVSQLAQAYLAWQEDRQTHPDLPCPVPPPRVWKVGGQYHLTRGFHRVDALKAAKLTEAEFEVVTGGTMPQAAVDAAEGNLDHKALKMKKGDVQKSFTMYWNNSPLVRKTTTSELARKFGVDRKTIDRWAELAEADGGKGREGGPRIDKNGKEVPVGGGSPTHKSAGETGDLFEVADRTGDGEGEGDDVQTDGGGEMRTPPPGVPEPEKGACGPRRADGEYPPDPRFMPNAEGADLLAVKMAGWKQRLEAVRSEMREFFPKGHPVGDQMVDFRGGAGQFAADLNALIDTLGHNRPAEVCPMCVGTGGRENGEACDTCHGYGFVTATDAAGLKAHWKRTGRRYDDLCKKADLTEMAEVGE